MFGRVPVEVELPVLIVEILLSIPHSLVIILE